MPEPIGRELLDLFHTGRLLELARAVIVLVVGLLVARLASSGLTRTLTGRLSAQHVMLIARGARWVFTGATLVTVLRHLGFDLGVLIGAAGIFSVAIGFASQTSASNLISGLFLIAERPFVVGDVITVAGRTGEVTSIDLLSVKLRTFDNLFVRIPNETLLKSEIVNVSYYPIRRIDLVVGVSYAEDLGRVEAVLREVAAEAPLCLDEPRPLFAFEGFADSAQNIKFGVWATRENYLEVSVQLPQAIKRAFEAHKIEIPYPQQVVHIRPLAAPEPAGAPSPPSQESKWRA